VLSVAIVSSGVPAVYWQIPRSKWFLPSYLRELRGQIACETRAVSVARSPRR
jgi:hypothetical protein